MTLIGHTGACMVPQMYYIAISNNLTLINYNHSDYTVFEVEANLTAIDWL